MASSNKDEESAGDSDSDVNLRGRLRNPGVGTTEIESHDDEAVDKLGDRLRENRDAEENESQKSLDEESPVEEVEDDDLEDFLLDALDSDSDAEEGGAFPGQPSEHAEKETDSGVGRPDESQDGKPGTDGTAPGTNERPESEKPSETSAKKVFKRRNDGGDRQKHRRSDSEESDSSERDRAGQNCESCGSISPPGMRFCVQCGAALKGGEVEELRDPPDLDRDKLDEQVPKGFQLVTINDDGTDGRAIALKSSETILGREGDTRFPTDEFLNPKHVRLTVEDRALFIEDMHSLNGTFLKLRGEVRLKPGDTFLMGRQVLRFERIEQDFDAQKTAADGTRYMGSPEPGGDYKILQVGVGNIIQNIYCLPESGVVLGREKGDIVFPRDKFMSGRHARIFTDEEPHLADLNSSNGTWIKLWEKTKLQEDDYIFMGQQLFRVELPK